MAEEEKKDEHQNISSQEQVLSLFKEEVQDAKLLLEFAIARGYKTEDGRRVSDSLIKDIKEAEKFLDSTALPPADERTKFEKAYRDLAILLSPITAKTLKDTDMKYGRTFWFGSPKRKISEGNIWSRKLTLWTLFFIVIAITGNLLAEVRGQFQPPIDEVSESGLPFRYWLEILIDVLVPFTYGGIGSCALLLRSCHKFIYKRQFDLTRVPEYYNRILLGVVSGGAIVLLISELSTDEGATIKLSAAALGFLAGYNTDFLFNTVERVVQAILPKVGVESVQRAVPPQSTVSSISAEGLTLKDLLDNYEKATDKDDKVLYKSLIDRWREQS